MPDDTKALAPQDAPERPRNALIPLPTNTPDLTWQDAADLIAKLHKANRPPFPHCGAPSILEDSNLIAHLLDAVSDGLTPAQAGNALGINAQTVTNWLNRAAELPEPPPHEHAALALFAYSVKSAQDRRRRRLLGSIEAAGHKGAQYWTAHAWLLERGYGNDYKLAQDKTGGGVVIQIGVKDSEVTVNTGDSLPVISLPD